MESWILAAFYVIAVMPAAWHPLHMYQLESYQGPGYLRWLRGAVKGLAMRNVLLIPFVLLGLWGGWMALAGGISLLIITMILCLPRKKAKKPFALTSRVRWQLAIFLILQCGIALGGVWMTEWLRYVLYGLGMALLPLTVLVSGWCNLPLRKIANGRYIRDAKRILRSMPNLVVIGVTGSYGKTSVKFYLEALLGVKYNVLATPASYNTPLGIVIAIREHLRPQHQFFICEMGARHVGDIRECCELTHPRHGVITAIGPQHLETFGSLENVMNTKLELCCALPEDGVCMVNWGSDSVRKAVECGMTAGREVLRYGIHEEAGYQAADLQVGPEGSRFILTAPNGECCAYKTALLGRHNVENLCGALAAAHHLGVSLESMVAAVRSIRPVAHRLELKRIAPGLTIIDDAFNANPAGTAAALEVLSCFGGVRILVTPGLVELGASEREENQRLGSRAAAVCDYVALVGEKRGEDIARGLQEAGYPRERWRIFDRFEEAFEWARDLDCGQPERVILLENDLPDNY